MKKLTFWKSLFLLFALIVGTSTNAWGQKVTYQHVFNAKPSTGNNVTLSSVAWNISATNLGAYNSGNYAGVQVGSSKASGSITLTSSSAWGSVAGTYKDKTKITEVRLWLNTGGTTVTPTVTIGGTEATSDGTTVVKNSSAGSDWTKTTKVTFTPASNGNSGTVVISASSTASPAFYICAMEIDCEEASGGNTPTISVDPTSLSDFTYVYGNGPSDAQTVSVSGSNLSANIGLSLDENSKYEMCLTENGTYTNSLTLNQSSGSVAATDIYVRLRSGLAKAANYEGTITLSSTDATSVEVNLSGSVTGQLYAVTVATGLTGGSIGADPTSAAEGAEVTLSATPSSGYRLSAWDVYKTGDATTKVTVSNNKFTMPDYAVTVSASFELIPTVTYTLATSVVPGRHYIIVGEKDDTYKAMGYDKGNNRHAVDVTVGANNTITVADDAGVYEFLVGVENDDDDYKGYFTIYDATSSTGYLYAAASGSNYLKTQTDNDVNGEWAITINGETGVATVVAKPSSNRNVMRYNGSSSIFSCYSPTNSQQDVYLYEKNGDTGSQEFTASINAACTDGKGNYYGTFSAPFAFTVPAGVTVSEIGIDAQGKLDVEEYEAGDIIPANTGVMISSTVAGDKTFTSAKGGTSVKGDSNKLRPTYWGLTAKEMGEADNDCLFYRLTMHNGTTIGYYWGAAEGASFAIPDANKAYLAVSTAQAAKMSGFAFDDTTTGINGVEEIAPVTKTRKVVKNGRLVIETANGEFTIDGARMK